MKVPPTELLRALAGGVQPAGDRAPASGSFDFQGMLDRARRDELRTDLPVRVPAGLSPGIDDSELEALSRSVDLAQGAGIERALIDLGSRAFRVDVRQRAVIDAPDAQLRAVGGIDGYVRRTGSAVGGDEARASTTLGPARIVRNTSLIDVLSRVSGGIV